MGNSSTLPASSPLLPYSSTNYQTEAGQRLIALLERPAGSVVATIGDTLLLGHTSGEIEASMRVICLGGRTAILRQLLVRADGSLPTAEEALMAPPALLELIADSLWAGCKEVLVREIASNFEAGIDAATSIAFAKAAADALAESGLAGYILGSGNGTSDSTPSPVSTLGQYGPWPEEVAQAFPIVCDRKDLMALTLEAASVMMEDRIPKTGAAATSIRTSDSDGARVPREDATEASPMDSPLESTGQPSGVNGASNAKDVSAIASEVEVAKAKLPIASMARARQFLSCLVASAEPELELRRKREAERQLERLQKSAEAAAHRAQVTEKAPTAATAAPWARRPERAALQENPSHSSWLPSFNAPQAAPAAIPHEGQGRTIDARNSTWRAPSSALPKAPTGKGSASPDESIASSFLSSWGRAMGAGSGETSPSSLPSLSLPLNRFPQSSSPGYPASHRVTADFGLPANTDAQLRQGGPPVAGGATFFGYATARAAPVSVGFKPAGIRGTGYTLREARAKDRLARV